MMKSQIFFEIIFSTKDFSSKKKVFRENFGFSPNTGCDANVKVYDKDPNKSQNTLEEVMSESDFIFLSVPTPSNADGSINLDIVDKALEEINNFNDRGNIILLRSTMIPGSTRKFQQKYPRKTVKFNTKRCFVLKNS